MYLFEYPTNIPSAANLMDVKLPGWHNKVNTGRLLMTHGERCILGQCFGDYQDGFRKLFNEMPDDRHFNDYIFGTYAETKPWIDEIMKRRFADQRAAKPVPTVERHSKVLLDYLTIKLRHGTIRVDADELPELAKAIKNAMQP